jgi:hypothetical protein
MPAKLSPGRWVANSRLTVDKPGEAPQVIKPGDEVKNPPQWLKDQGLVSPANGDVGGEQNEENA